VEVPRVGASPSDERCRNSGRATRRGRSRRGEMLDANAGGQLQRAGSNSLQIQAAGDVNLGVSEDRAREIALDTARQVLSTFTHEANSVIQDRILKLDDRVIAALVRENRLQVFADPGFQRTYRKAQEGAAASERDADYDLLAALLVDRAARGRQRTIRAGIERSIEIVDRIDEEALRGLTIFQAVMQYSPTAGDIDLGLQTIARLLSQLLDGPLPRGSDWLDHLDILDAVRVNSGGGLRKFHDFWPTSHMPGYMSVGAVDSGEPKTWMFASTAIPWQLAPHKLKDGFVRVNAPSKAVFLEQFSMLPQSLTEQLFNDAESVFHLSEIDESCREPLMGLIRAIPELKQIEDWWDQIAGAVSVTAVGRVLARANAERLDSEKILPPLS
jgi:hypothetical protein